MATYQYECINDSCPSAGDYHYIERSVHEAEPEYQCVCCSTPLVRIYNVPAVKFNASGFYSTDNPKR